MNPSSRNGYDMEIKQIDKFNQRDQSNNMYKIMYITTLLLYIEFTVYVMLRKHFTMTVTKVLKETDLL